MAKFSNITCSQVMRLLATRAAPTILDVRLEEDVKTIPRLIPTARRLSHFSIAEHAQALEGKHVVVVCHKGLKLSQGAAALLRTFGIRAEALEGGAVAWADEDLPMIPLDQLPSSYPGTTWVTRNRPKIDRIACPWLIRRFIDPQARVLFVPASEVHDVADRFDAIAFDVSEAPWTHAGELCTFDSLLDGFSLKTKALEIMARVIRGADTNRHNLAPECAGLLALSVGLSRSYSDDNAQLEAGLDLYDALYRWARDGQGEEHNSWTGTT